MVQEGEYYSLDVCVNAVGVRKGSVFVGEWSKEYRGSVLSCRIGMMEDANIPLRRENVPYRMSEDEEEFTAQSPVDIVLDRSGLWCCGSEGIFLVNDVGLNILDYDDRSDRKVACMTPVWDQRLLASREELTTIDPILFKSEGSWRGSGVISWTFSLGAFVKPLVYDTDEELAYSFGRMQRFFVKVTCSYDRLATEEEIKRIGSLERSRRALDSVIDAIAGAKKEE